VPLAALRISDRVIATIPGEMTEEMGKRVRASVLGAVQGAGIRAVVLSGLANEYLSYFTTPEEYERQHYEGGSTLYGRYSSNLLKQSLTELAARLVNGQPAPDPYPYDPNNGLTATSSPFPRGASSASAGAQPGTTARLARANFGWSGGPKGEDRPVDHPFVTIRRRVGSSWQDFADDLGLQILWKVDDSGNYSAQWEVPLDAPTGTYEFRISANGYRLESAPFQVIATGALAVRRLSSQGSNAIVALDYPVAVPEQDLTYRPQSASGGTVTYTAGGSQRTVRSTSATAFALPGAAGQTITIAAGAARDRYGNANAQAATLQP
jgi:neutral ceramidase